MIGGEVLKKLKYIFIVILIILLIPIGLYAAAYYENKIILEELYIERSNFTDKYEKRIEDLKDDLAHLEPGIGAGQGIFSFSYQEGNIRARINDLEKQYNKEKKSNQNSIDKAKLQINSVTTWLVLLLFLFIVILIALIVIIVPNKKGKNQMTKIDDKNNYQLKVLKNLYDNNILSESEYKEKRDLIINKLFTNSDSVRTDNNTVAEDTEQRK